MKNKWQNNERTTIDYSNIQSFLCILSCLILYTNFFVAIIWLALKLKSADCFEKKLFSPLYLHNLPPSPSRYQPYTTPSSTQILRSTSQMQRSTSQIQRKFYAVHLKCIKTIDVLYTWTYTSFPLIRQKMHSVEFALSCVEFALIK